MHDETRGGSPTWALLAVSVIVVACATTSAPTGEAAFTSRSVEAARGDDASDHAGEDLAQADAKLVKARELSLRGEHVQARRLAEEAAVQADLARAKSAAEHSRQALALAEDRLRGARERMGLPAARVERTP